MRAAAILALVLLTAGRGRSRVSERDDKDEEIIVRHRVERTR